MSSNRIMGLVLALVVLAGIAVLVGPVRSQPATAGAPAFIGTGAAADNGYSNAWFVDVQKQQVVFCVAGINGKSPSCAATKLP